jgi:hypothetical protein
MHPSRNDGAFGPILSETFRKSGIFAFGRHYFSDKYMKMKQNPRQTVAIGDVVPLDSRCGDERAW